MFLCSLPFFIDECYYAKWHAIKYMYATEFKYIIQMAYGQKCIYNSTCEGRNQIMPFNKSIPIIIQQNFP